MITTFHFTPFKFMEHIVETNYAGTDTVKVIENMHSFLFIS